ncbi:protein of unknown function [Methylacidimicrobium sp. AP8]|uniref:hypothetical protein n=1 Tax=Methylacidimicrobium sp. AP8 TaxID=2730359 RepID=UPI0018C13F68|nr:hypothetical protein [Methylacidimicrobium sp. AP8]CAB4243959.1 protein of unknown function [Methylacidimicrobium sp. AP8]
MKPRAIPPGRIIKTRIQIEASREAVRSEPADFPSYPDWNPFFSAVWGEPLPGADLRVSPPGSRPVTLRAELRRVVPCQELRRFGSWVSPGLVDWDHRFLLEPRGPKAESVPSRAAGRWTLRALDRGGNSRVQGAPEERSLPGKAEPG